MASGASTSTYTARFLTPDLMERGRINSLSCPVWLDGALVAPSSGMITIYDGSGTKQVDGASATVTASVATYSYSPASTLAWSEGWRLEWSLVISGTTHVFKQDGSLVRNVLYPSVTDADLFRRHRALDPNSASPVSTVTDFQDYLDEAWTTIQLRLISRGNRPNLVLNPSALRDLHLTLTLALIFDDFSTSLNETYSDRAAEYRRQYEEAWSDLRFVYASSDDDTEGPSQHRRAAQPTIWLSSRGG